MKKQSFLFGALVLLAAGVVTHAFQQPPTVTITPANPSTLQLNSTSSVIITAQVTDARVITNSVILLAVDPITGAQSIIGTMKEQDPNTADTSSSYIFTAVIQPPTASPQLYMYEVSFAFKGILRRSLSLPITVAVAPPGIVLPPDPGPAGMQTLAGIDSDGDGLRDDIQRWIAVNQSNSARIRAALIQQAKGTEAAILSNSQPKAIAALDSEAQGRICLDGIVGTLPGADIGDNLEAIALNTPARIQAYLAANSQLSGTNFSLPTVASRTSFCSFNPSSLPN